MEEIKQAGGIGCFEKGNEGKGSFPFELPSAPEITTDAEKPTKSNYDTAGCSPSRSRKQSHSSYYAIDSATSRDASAKEVQRVAEILDGHMDRLVITGNKMIWRVRKTKHREISQSSSSISKYRDNRSSSQSNSENMLERADILKRRKVLTTIRNLSAIWHEVIRLQQF
ncbi:U11/U12 small nuclear ribonucleoprotein 48 kDa protein isoform X2 [Prunus yedoensis var. nudiflora]|uniref:U11/U12 small nuclear ribonucleoprotein 48 kDa protein isoform X2 n=1 Tax=Prunus yedoensis var. nudiflora TaxID=2094558 RepID=A0A314Z884_PRUYE|nr:U11/U12 small nuclear ribonucleoprotein 48 kDa protein isoform X2 [Prunus yedoensis var. nudiflora]